MSQQQLEDALRACRLHVKAEPPRLPRSRRLRRELERAAEYDEGGALAPRRIARAESSSCQEAGSSAAARNRRSASGEPPVRIGRTGALPSVGSAQPMKPTVRDNRARGASLWPRGICLSLREGLQHPPPVRRAATCKDVRRAETLRDAQESAGRDLLRSRSADGLVMKWLAVGRGRGHFRIVSSPPTVFGSARPACPTRTNPLSSDRLSCAWPSWRNRCEIPEENGSKPHAPACPPRPDQAPAGRTPPDTPSVP